MEKNQTFGSELAKQLPIEKIYDDLFQPSIKEVGSTLKGCTKIALAPLNGMIWGYSQIENYLEEKIPEYFDKNKVSFSKIKTPSTSIAVPLIEAMRYTEDSQIREIFVNLLGSSMNYDMEGFVHPAFVEVIKQFSLIDSLVFNSFKEYNTFPCILIKEIDTDEKITPCIHMIFDFKNSRSVEEHHNLFLTKSIDNLKRLGLINLNNSILELNYDYNNLKKSNIYSSFESQITEGSIVQIEKYRIELTQFGRDFSKCCF